MRVSFCDQHDAERCAHLGRPPKTPKHLPRILPTAESNKHITQLERRSRDIVSSRVQAPFEVGVVFRREEGLEQVRGGREGVCRGEADEGSQAGEDGGRERGVVGLRANGRRLARALGSVSQPHTPC